MKARTSQDKTNKKAVSSQEVSSPTPSSKEASSPLQRLVDSSPRVQEGARYHAIANGEPPMQRNNTGLPDPLKSGVEQLSGQSLDDVKVHRNSSKPTQFNAHAYAQGSSIHLAPGQDRHLPHEAWHVAQQKQGRVKPTTEVGGAPVNDSSSLEKEADVMGRKAMQGPFNSSEAPAQRKTRSSVVQKADTPSVPATMPALEAVDDQVSEADMNFAISVANRLRNHMLSKQIEYVYQGMGGGGAKWYRSDAVKKFREIMKTSARVQALKDVDKAARERSGPATATTDFEQLIGGNIAYDSVKDVINAQLREEAEEIVGEVGDELFQAFKNAILIFLKRNPGRYVEAQDRAIKCFLENEEGYHNKLTKLKDEVVGKRISAPKEGEETTAKGAEMIDRVVDRVESEHVGRESLKKAIRAPSMNKGMEILTGLIDNVIPSAGETVELGITFTIPTGQPGLNVEINMSGLAARGQDGATTAGVATMGDPKRVEVAANFSVGVGAEAIGLKSSGSIGVFVRAGSNKGTEHALQALSYGAYRGAPAEAFQNLWAPKDKATDVRKKVNEKNLKKLREELAANPPATDPEETLDSQYSRTATPLYMERTKRQRAEMWAAMIEEKYFKGTGEDTFADVGMNISGGFGVNFGAVGKTGGLEMELGISESIFSRYNEKILKSKMKDGNDELFAGRVLNDKAAKTRRDKAVGDKKLALGGSIGFKVGAGANTVELGLSMSGTRWDNWGVEIVGGASTTSGQTSPSDYDTLMNGWVRGLGEMIKKLRNAVGKDIEGDKTGVKGNVLQVTADLTSLIDAASKFNLRDAVASGTETISKPPPGVHFDTPVGDSIASDAVNKASKLAASTSLQFVFTFGNNGGSTVARFELRSKQGLDIGGGTPVKVSASKTTRLIGVGYEDGQMKGELFGGRLE
jgi:hypothetical protein